MRHVDTQRAGQYVWSEIGPPGTPSRNREGVKTIQALVKAALTPVEISTLEYLLECSAESIKRAEKQWAMIEMRTHLRDVWSVFNDIVIDNEFAKRAVHDLYPNIDFEENLEQPF